MQLAKRLPVTEVLAKATPAKRSKEDFILPCLIRHKKLALLVYKQEDYKPYVL